MAGLQDPKPGVVVNYPYLWQSEHKEGHIEGKKERHCVVIGVKDNDVRVVPITHEPQKHTAVVNVPQNIKKGLELDNERSWIVTNETNRFKWTEKNLKSYKTGEVKIYGELPAELTEKVRKSARQYSIGRNIKRMDRDEILKKYAEEGRSSEPSPRKPTEGQGKESNKGQRIDDIKARLKKQSSSNTLSLSKGKGRKQ
ncbi:MAG: hypothetical protein AAFZ15_24920 [Bacteroidota bacterium]